MSQALYRANISADLSSKYNGVFISSEVRKQEGQGGRSYYQHPRDPLLKPRPGSVMVMTTPAAVGSSDPLQGSPKIFLIMSSVSAAIRVRKELQEVHLQLPFGKDFKMTPAPEASPIEAGLTATQNKMQQQVKQP